jgi:hypothetical protein
MPSENGRHEGIIARLNPLIEAGARERVICRQHRKVEEELNAIKRQTAMKNGAEVWQNGSARYDGITIPTLMKSVTVDPK